MMQNSPTTTRTTTFDKEGNISEETREFLCSVEVGETAKGELTVKSVKVYAATAQEAGRQAMEEYRRLKHWMAE